MANPHGDSPLFGSTSFPSLDPDKQAQRYPRSSEIWIPPQTVIYANQSPSEAGQVHWGFSQWACNPSAFWSAMPAAPWTGPQERKPVFSDSKMQMDDNAIPRDETPIAPVPDSEKFATTAIGEESYRDGKAVCSAANKDDNTGRVAAQRPEVSTKPRESGASFPRLGSLDISSLDNSKTLFYLGVLATQSLLLPRFQYTSSNGSREWAAKLTMYGYTFETQNAFNSQADAKLEVCREALKKLKNQFPEWTVPPEPTECPIVAGWNWVEILRDYCVHNALPKPIYTKYTRNNGYRHEIELPHGSSFGALKHYSQEWDSKNASAHMGLHTLLVLGNGASCSFPGPFTLRRSDESLLALVPREPRYVQDQTGGCNRPIPKRPADDGSDTSKSEYYRRRKRQYKRTEPKAQAYNANLLPLVNNRLGPVETFDQKEERKWKMTHIEIQIQTAGMRNYTEKLQKTCQLLSLDIPEIRIERLDGRLIETDGEYNAAAYFKNDPFLTRAGAIGTVKIKGSIPYAKEACACQVVSYLLKMVREDNLLEEEAAMERDRVNNWAKITTQDHIKKGLKSPAADVEMGGY